jgi:GNAT superfamily N-acetyltransferase
LDFPINNFSETHLNDTDILLMRAYNTQHSFARQLKRYLEIQPDGSFVGMDVGGKVVGFGAAADFGNFSYIGLMGTDPSFQGQGLSHLIMARILDFLDGRRCTTVFLDARPAAASLYEQFGFVDEDVTIVYKKQSSPVGYASQKDRPKGIDFFTKEEEITPEIDSFDCATFGAHRRSLLRSFWNDDPARFLVSRDLPTGQIDGYLVGQENVIGPWIANDYFIARRLLFSSLRFSFEEEPFVYASEANAQATKLLSEFGFKPQRSLRHMRRGAIVERKRTTKIYGQASLGLG